MLQPLVEPRRSEARPRCSGKAEHVPDGATGATTARVDGLDADRHLPRGQAHVDRERTAGERARADDPPVDAHEDARGAGRPDP